LSTPCALPDLGLRPEGREFVGAGISGMIASEVLAWGSNVTILLDMPWTSIGREANPCR
jgi:hypothetical protein